MSRVYTDTRNLFVLNDMTFQTVLTLATLYDWDLAILDVETAFLYRDLKEDIYMDLPAVFFHWMKTFLK